MSNEKAMYRRRPRGSGSIFHMRGSEVWWIKYHRNGKPIRESSRSTKLRYAEKLLTRRLAEILTGTYTSPKLEKIRVSELADDLIREHRINGKKSLGHLGLDGSCTCGRSSASSGPLK